MRLWKQKCVWCLKCSLSVIYFLSALLDWWVPCMDQIWICEILRTGQHFKVFVTFLGRLLTSPGGVAACIVLLGDQCPEGDCVHWCSVIQGPGSPCRILLCNVMISVIHFSCQWFQCCGRSVNMMRIQLMQRLCLGLIWLHGFLFLFIYF